MQFTNTISVHLFNTIQEAETAINLVNQGEGIPVSEDSITRTYTTYQEKDGYIFIKSDDVTQKHLGQPTTIEITTEI